MFKDGRKRRLQLLREGGSATTPCHRGPVSEGHRMSPRRILLSCNDKLNISSFLSPLLPFPFVRLSSARSITAFLPGEVQVLLSCTLGDMEVGVTRSHLTFLILHFLPPLRVSRNESWKSDCIISPLFPTPIGCFGKSVCMDGLGSWSDGRERDCSCVGRL